MDGCMHGDMYVCMYAYMRVCMYGLVHCMEDEILNSKTPRQYLQHLHMRARTTHIHILLMLRSATTRCTMKLGAFAGPTGASTAARGWVGTS